MGCNPCVWTRGLVTGGWLWYRYGGMINGVIDRCPGHFDVRAKALDRELPVHYKVFGSTEPICPFFIPA